VEVESKKERRRDTQIGDAKKKRDEKRELRDAAYKATLTAAEVKALPTAANGAEDAVEVKQEEEGPERKKVKLEDEAAVPILEGTDPWDMLPKEELDVEMDTAIIDPPVPAVTIPIVTPSNSTSQRQTTATLPLAGIKKFTFKAGPQTRGHTSYLTFATLLPTAAPTTEVFEEAREALKPPMTKDVSAVNTDVHVDEVVDASSNV
jgi:tRNA (adenine57-N1/adenine58-N1)-methyltransferase